MKSWEKRVVGAALDSALFGLDEACVGPWQAHRRLDTLVAADAAVAVTRLTARASVWAARLGPPFDPALAPLCCMAPAFVAPWMSPGGAWLAARSNMWIFAVDAWSDAPGAPRDQIRDGIGMLRAVAGGADPPREPLALALAEIRDAVGGPLLPPWRRAAESALAGNWFEYEAARQVAEGGPAPSLARYLRHGADSIALGMVVTAMWSDMWSDLWPDSEADLPDPVLEGLHRALRDAALAVRLANDLRGHARERAEGVLDALTLGLAPTAAGALLDRYRHRCRSRLRPLTVQAPGPAIALERQLLWSIRHYQRLDAGHAEHSGDQR
jgi:terpene synthase-like protein